MKEIIQKSISDLLEQRGRCLEKMGMINFNEPNHTIKQIMYENQIRDIDMGVQNLLTHLPTTTE